MLQDEVTPVSKHLVGGRFQGLGSDEIVVNTELARDLNLAAGDRVRVTSNTGASDSFTVVGIYSRGQARGDAPHAWDSRVIPGIGPEWIRAGARRRGAIEP